MILGIKLKFQWHYFLMLGLFIASGNGGFVLLTAFFAMLHELSHGITARALGYRPDYVLAGFFGGIIQMRQDYIRPFHEILIHLSGPVFNLVVCTLVYTLDRRFLIMNDSNLHGLLLMIMLSNLMLGLFNLMPFYPLDGGKIIGLYLSFFFGYGKAAKITGYFSKLFFVFLFLFGIYLLQYNVLNILVSAIALHLFLSGCRENQFLFYKVVKSIEGEQEIPLETMVVSRNTVGAWKLLQKHKPEKNRLITVVNEKGHYQGQLTEQELLEGVYACGIYSDCSRLLEYRSKRKSKDRNGEWNDESKDEYRWTAG